MDEKIEAAIEILASKITTACQPDQALKYTQAALNLAQVKGLLGEGEKKKKVSAS